jgi:hypothetical protein
LAAKAFAERPDVGPIVDRAAGRELLVLIEAADQPAERTVAFEARRSSWVKVLMALPSSLLARSAPVKSTSWKEALVCLR